MAISNADICIGLTRLREIFGESVLKFDEPHGELSDKDILSNLRVRG